MNANRFTVSPKAPFILTFITIAAVWLCGNSVSQMPGPPGPGGPPFDREEMIKRFDTDGDGKLSDDEEEAMHREMQGFMGRMGRGRGGPPGMMGQREELMEKFDADGDGKPNDDERKAARKYMQDKRGRRSESLPERGEASEPVSMEVDYYPDADLYDESVLRTLFLEFPNEDWYEEMGDFQKTDVDVPADLTVDGVKYPSVGVRFRGNSSAMVRNAKKPFNITIDYDDPNQRLYGYRTLNLLNSNSDPSFIREVLYSRICREYIPAPKANFVKLVINGENWGIYVNVQQFNTDFLQDWFGTRDGVRWKVPQGGRGGSLSWNGTEVENYKNTYQLKTGKAPDNAWENLVELCRILDQTSDEELEAALDPIFDIDEALWYIALENVFIDGDGYISRGSDYNLYMDPNGRFYMIPHDNNETFRFAGGGGPNMYMGREPMLSPVVSEDNEDLPVISRLLSIPHLRARYLAHVRTIASEWLDWEKLSTIISEYQLLIDAEVKADDKKLYSYEAFANSQTEDHSGGEGGGPPGMGPPGDFGGPGGNFGGRGDPDRESRGRGGRGRGGFGRSGRGGPGGGVTPSLKRFATERREFLLSHAEIDKPAPVIKSVSQPTAPLATDPLIIKAKIGGDVELDSVILYYAEKPGIPFEKVTMLNNGGIYSAEIPPFPAGTVIRYYVEARSTASVGTTTLWPSGIEQKPLIYQVIAPVAEKSPVVINELMALNTTSLTDPQGENDDWIELHNVSDKEIDLSGMYLSDSKDNLHKWAFPENTIISSKGYLIVWADENGKAESGLHASFKLSKNGEIVMLIDSDERGNAILDMVEFGEQEEDSAIGRLPDGSGEFRKVKMTPGEKNKS